MDDETLLAAVAVGDDRALRALFERHAPWVAGRLRRVLAASAVEDVVQETFIAVWRGAGGYHGGGAVDAWIWASPGGRRRSGHASTGGPTWSGVWS